jgi:hypothetical protein
MTENNNEKPPFDIALVIDNAVVDVLHSDGRLADILLSNPTIVDVTSEDGTQLAFVGDKYNPEDGSFSRDGVLPESIVDETGDFIYKLALVLNEEVVDVLFINERLAAILLSDPIIVNVTGDDGKQLADYGDIFDPATQTFSKGSQIVPQEEIDAQMNKIAEELSKMNGWVYNAEVGHHVPPVSYPQDGKVYNWDNDVANWVEADQNQFIGVTIDGETV